MGRRAIHTRRYAKRVPGHQIQVDVKFLNYIKPRSPHLNGKVERSHRTDQEKFYNLSRPHGAHNGETPYEALKHLLE